MNTEYTRLTDDTRDYLKLRGEWLRALTIEKSSRIIALLLTLFCTALVAVIALGYLSAAAVVALEQAWGSLLYALLTMGLIFVIATILLYMLRKRLFLNPLVRTMSRILSIGQPQKSENA